jgi:NitT/TauT family transport system substrate-binding protein
MRLRSPLLTQPTSLQRPETLTLRIGIQNGTIPTVTAGLIIQQLSLLEHFLPRNGRYSRHTVSIAMVRFFNGRTDY